MSLSHLGDHSLVEKGNVDNFSDYHNYCCDEIFMDETAK